MPIILKSKVFTIINVKTKTTAKMLKDLKVGDEIQLTVEASSVGGNRGRTYSTYIAVENVNTGDLAHFSFNQIGILYKVFDLN